MSGTDTRPPARPTTEVPPYLHTSIPPQTKSKPITAAALRRQPYGGSLTAAALLTAAAFQTTANFHTAANLVTAAALRRQPYGGSLTAAALRRQPYLQQQIPIRQQTPSSIGDKVPKGKKVQGHLKGEIDLRRATVGVDPQLQVVGGPV